MNREETVESLMNVMDEYTSLITDADFEYDTYNLTIESFNFSYGSISDIEHDSDISVRNCDNGTHVVWKSDAIIAIADYIEREFEPKSDKTGTVQDTTVERLSGILADAVLENIGNCILLGTNSVGEVVTKNFNYTTMAEYILSELKQPHVEQLDIPA